MSAKFLHTFADENPELHRQIGCMTGIFQMFDPHHLITGRRQNGQNHKRITSGYIGQVLLTSSSSGAEQNSCPPHMLLEKNSSKISNENGISMESTRNSFSSSSCSSFSSLDCNKSTQQETPAMDHSSYSERSLKNPPKLKNYDFDAAAAQAKSKTDPANASLQLGRPSLDFRDVIKDSIYKDNYALSVRTSVNGSKLELKNHTLKLKDSPRPMLSKPVNGSYMTEVNEKSKVPTDLSESLQVLLKFKEAPWHLTERNEPRRKSYEAKDSPFASISGDGPRFSYDGQEFGPSLYSQDGSKLSSKLRELPRLSLDSREGSLRSSGFDSRTHSISKDLERSVSTRRAPIAEYNHQGPGSYKQSPSVVAKLMGLEAMPTPNHEKADSAHTHSYESTSNLSKKKGISLTTTTYITTHDSKEDQLSSSLKSFRKGPMKIPDPPLRSQSHLRLPIEPAPWRQREKIRVPQKMAFKYKDADVKQQPESVFGEIEKRLKDLEFQQSNKDLRALKQILDAMHAKGLLETKKGKNELSEETVYEITPGSAQSLKPVQAKGSHTVGAYESPIVIMKPANSINRLGTSSIIPLDGFTNLQRLKTNNPPVNKIKASTNARISKDQSPKVSSREPNNRPLMTDKKVRKEDNGLQNTCLRISDGSSRPNQFSKDNDEISTKISNSISPRLLQQKKLEAEKKFRAPSPSPESNKPPRPSANRHSSETVSPRTRLRRKPTQPQQNGDQLSDVSSGTRSLTHQDDEPSRSESSIILLSKVDIEVTSINPSEVLNEPGIVSDNASSNMNHEVNSDILNEEVSAIESSTVAHEQTSPNSVLDASLYETNFPPGKKHLNSYKNDESCNTPDCCSPTIELDSPTPEFSLRISQKKLMNIETLVQKLRELSSIDDETSGTDHIASLCETQNPDHRYVSEILLASGLLMKDFTSGPLSFMQIQLHPSGYLINPDLFFVLEQTKSAWLAKPEAVNEASQSPKSDPEKLRRKMIFNLVNELLLQKLENGNSNPYPSLAKNIRFPSGQRLLNELCSEIEKIKSESLAGNKDDDGNLMSGEDILKQSGNWINLDMELPGIVLEIERSIFKELVDELVNTEPGLYPKVKVPRRRRQLFTK